MLIYHLFIIYNYIPTKIFKNTTIEILWIDYLCLFAKNDIDSNKDNKYLKI